MDHKALSFLKTCRFTNERLIRYALTLQNYDYTINHIPETKNYLSDLFNRLTYKTNSKEPEIIMATTLAAKISNELKNMLKNISNLQQKDEKIVKIIENCKKSTYKTYE